MQASDLTKKEFYSGGKHVKLCILMVFVLKVIINSILRLIYTFIEMFGSPSTRVIFRLTTIAFFLVLFIWPHMFRAPLSYNSLILVMCTELGFGPLQASTVGSFEK